VRRQRRAVLGGAAHLTGPGSGLSDLHRAEVQTGAPRPHLGELKLAALHQGLS
jgi:hypothetical protein